MNKQPSYHTLYATLGLPQDASSEQLRLHYRRLAQRLHPDAPSGDGEKFQQLHSAYETLRRYHLVHGEMPLQTPPSKPNHLPKEIGSSDNIHNSRTASTATAGIRRQPLQPKSLLKRHAGSLCLAALAAGILWQNLSPLGTDIKRLPPPLPSREFSDIAEKTFSLGASITDVVDAQGIPDSSEDGIWVYGNSRVFFFEGKVAGWDDLPDSPLHLARELNLSAQSTFSLGATAEKVFSAQGVPNHMSQHEWRYGLSSVYFRHNRVTGWHEDPANPLAIERLPPASE